MNTQSTTRLQESAIISAVLDGETEPYRHLVERYHTGLIQHLYNLVHDGDIAEDLAQEAFLRAYQKLAQYNADFAFSTWLYKIGTSLALRHLKQQKPQRDFIDLEESLPDKKPSMSEAFDQSLQAERIRAAVSRLPLQYQQVVSLYYWDDCSYEEIAATLDRPIGTVRTWLHRSKELLRKELYGRV